MRPARRRATFKHVSDLAAFFGPPARRIIVFRSFAYWQSERRVFGSMVWGRPDEQDIRQMAAAHEVGADPRFAPHNSLIDVRAIEAVDLMAFEHFLGYLKARREAWSPTVSQQVVLHGGGLAHATVTGMFQLLRPGHAVAFLEDPLAAYATVDAADVRDELEALRLGIMGLPEIVRLVRAALDELSSRATATAIARHAGHSLRSLQRHLSAAGTSIEQERQQHLLRASEQLLEHTEMSLDAIAAHLGVSSASHLVSLFRKLRGTTPGALRSRARRD